MCLEVSTLSNELIQCHFSSVNEWPIALDMTCHRALSVVACTFEFTNAAKGDYYILKRDTPLEGLHSPFVTVYHEGYEIKYQGIVAIRLPPKKGDFLLLKAGQSVSATVQITDAFTFSSDGLYNIRYVKPLKFLTKHEIEMQDHGSYIEKISQAQVSVSRYVSLEDTHLLTVPSIPSASKPDRTVQIETCCKAHFIGGTKAQRDTIQEVHYKLCSGYHDAKLRLGQNKESEKWFGRYHSNRDIIVRDALRKCEIGIGFHKQTYDFLDPKGDCAGTISYNFINDVSNTVYICSEFDQLPSYCSSTGEQSKEEILANAWSQVFAGLDVYKTSINECKDLAKNNQILALQNSVNYALFYCKVQ